MKNFAVFGLGRFGTAVARELFEVGHDVLAVDTDRDRVQSVADLVTHAVVGDARDPAVLNALGIGEYDCAVVAVGNDVGSSALITMRLKEAGVPRVVCKAMSHVHQRLLEKVGADHVVFPEHEMGVKLAQGLSSSNVLNFIELSEDYGIPTIGIPGTIDNDLEYTDYTLGFDTAVNTCLDIINKLRDTMTSHERISVVEVMGRRCGDIALYSGIASGAEIIIVPEIAYDMEDVVLRINRSRANGKHSNIIVLAEGVANAEEFSKKLQEMTTYSVRGTTIGHVQRGGSPSMADRMLAAQFGNRAVRMLKEGIGNRVVGIRRNEIVDLDIIEAVSMKKKFNYELYETLQMISM